MAQQNFVCTSRFLHSKNLLQLTAASSRWPWDPENVILYFHHICHHRLTEGTEL